MFELSAVLVAAGRGRRFIEKSGDMGLPSKVFLEWNGRPIFLKSLENLLSWVDGSVALVLQREHEELARAWVEKLSQKDRVIFARGGDRRQDSVRSGIETLSLCRFVAIHDAARPVLSAQMLQSLKEKLQNHEAVVPAIRITETLKEVDAQGRILRTVDRAKIVRVQTPQVFKFDLIHSVHQRLMNSAVEFTDDAMMCEHFDIPVHMTEGCPSNVKITTPEDLPLLEKELLRAGTAR